MAGKRDFTVDAGATFAFRAEALNDDLSAINVTDYLARMQARRYVEFPTPAVSLEIGEGIEIESASDGSFIITLTPEQTSDLGEGRYLYDLEIEAPGGVITRLLEGVLNVKANVTR